MIIVIQTDAAKGVPFFLMIKTQPGRIIFQRLLFQHGIALRKRKIFYRPGRPLEGDVGEEAVHGHLVIAQEQ